MVPPAKLLALGALGFLACTPAGTPEVASAVTGPAISVPGAAAAATGSPDAWSTVVLREAIPGMSFARATFDFEGRIVLPRSSVSDAMMGGPTDQQCCAPCLCLDIAPGEHRKKLDIYLKRSWNTRQPLIEQQIGVSEVCLLLRLWQRLPFFFSDLRQKASDKRSEEMVMCRCRCSDSRQDVGVAH